MSGEKRTIRVFLAEDHAPDVMLIRESLSAAGLVYELERAADGEVALERLLRCTGSDRPDVIILDLNLPRLSGFAVLSRLRENRILAIVPVVILTSSKEPSDREEAARLGAAAFISKPPDLDGFIKTVADALRRLPGLTDREAAGAPVAGLLEAADCSLNTLPPWTASRRHVRIGARTQRRCRAGGFSRLTSCVHLSAVPLES